MKPQGRVFLVGPMASGKSTVGKMLASMMDVPFMDSDQVISERCGADIPWIFDVEGEAGFREREILAIDELSQVQPLVLATGGGAILSLLNRQRLGARGIVIYLRTTVSQQLSRTHKDQSRPLLKRPDKEQVLQKLMKEREPLYAEIADITVETGRKSPKNVARQLLEKVVAYQ